MRSYRPSGHKCCFIPTLYYGRTRVYRRAFSSRYIEETEQEIYPFFGFLCISYVLSDIELCIWHGPTFRISEAGHPARYSTDIRWPDIRNISGKQFFFGTSFLNPNYNGWQFVSVNWVHLSCTYLCRYEFAFSWKVVILSCTKWEEKTVPSYCMSKMPWPISIVCLLN